jgi:hypothetical protein
MKVNADKIMQQIIASYEHIFGDGSALQEIHNLIHALEQDKPVLDLLESSRGSFSTIFVPFHAGTITADGIQFRHLNLPPPCLEFMENCAKIESLVDELPAREVEPDGNTRKQLVVALRNFLEHFPSTEDVVSWKK